MDFLQLATDRYSVRSFSDRPIEPEKMEKILKAGQVAPTAVNFQPQKIYILKSKAALDTLHAALPFLGGLALFLGLPLALADTAGHEVARFPKAWHNGLPLAAALLTVNEAVCRVYVLVPGQFHTGGCLVDQRPDFCGNLNHTVSSSFTL